MSRDFPMLLEHLRQKTGEVELDVPPAQAGGGDAAAAARLAKAREVAIRRGDRVARLYKLVGGRRASSNGSGEQPSAVVSVTENECRLLTAAGATWTGPVANAPVPHAYLDRIRVRGFRCVQDVEFPLTPLHALIGPNDSGKSTLLEAIGSVAMGAHEPSSTRTLYSGGSALSHIGGALIQHSQEVDATEAFQDPRLQQSRQTIQPLIGPVRLLHLDPDQMRQPRSLIPHGTPLEYGSRGEGLPAVYDALLSRKTSVFLEISKRFTQLFPTAKSIQLTNPSNATKALGIELLDGRSISAPQLSEGMLYWLAFAALPYLQPTPLILIEEPENGLHPSRIGDVMRVLREISKTSQIILATHHPLVINEMQSDEVTIITRTPERGTIATPLSRTKNFEQRSKVYALGELWLNYADGEFESDLVADSTLPSAAGSHAGQGVDRGRG